MARVVLDPGVIVQGAESDGPPGRLLDAWVDGAFDLVVSPHLLEEVTDVLSRPKLASRLDSTVVGEMLRLVREAAVMASDGRSAQVCRDLMTTTSSPLRSARVRCWYPATRTF